LEEGEEKGDYLEEGLLGRKNSEEGLPEEGLPLLHSDEPT